MTEKIWILRVTISVLVKCSIIIHLSKIQSNHKSVQELTKINKIKIIMYQLTTKTFTLVDDVKIGVLSIVMGLRILGGPP